MSVMHFFGLGRIVSSALALWFTALVAAVTYGLFHRWGASQWGDLGTWIAGIGTTAAVIVALWQTKLARDTATAATAAAQAEIERVNERLARELRAADDRLARELDASRRLEQLRTLPPIWDQIGDLAFPFLAYLDAVGEAHLLVTQQDVDRFMEVMNPWMEAIQRLELVFTPALMLISEPNTQDAVTQLYKRTRRLQVLSQEACGTAMRDKQQPDLQPLRDLMKEINTSRKTMTNIVREHLTEAAPLQSD
ncbi:hypothetical protein [Nocardia sp. NPDC003183]